MNYKIMKIAFWSLIFVAFATEVYAVGQLAQVPQIPQLPQSMSTPTSVVVEVVLTGILTALGWMGKKLYNSIEANQVKHESLMEKLNDKIDASVLTLTERVAKIEQKNDDCKHCNT